MGLMAVENIYITFNLNFNPNFFKLITTLIYTIIALIELLQAKKIIKHNNRIIAVIAIKEKLEEYITIKVYIYIYKRSL